MAINQNISNLKIGIVILNYNHAIDCINLLNSFIVKLPDNYYSLIIDNYSQDLDKLKVYCIDNKYSILKENDINKPWILNQVTLITLNENRGYARGNNIGLKFLYKNNFQYAFILNPDVEIHNISIFEILIKFLNNHKKVGFISPKIIFPDGKVQNHFKRVDFSTIFINFSFPLSEIIIKAYKKIELLIMGYNYIYSGVGCFYAINLYILNKINYFDENTFLYNEEQIIGERLLSNGYKFVYLPKLSVVHNHNYEEKTIDNKHYKESFEYYLNTYINPNKIIKNLILLSIKYRSIISKRLKTIL